MNAPGIFLRSPAEEQRQTPPPSGGMLGGELAETMVTAKNRKAYGDEGLFQPDVFHLHGLGGMEFEILDVFELGADDSGMRHTDGAHWVHSHLVAKYYTTPIKSE
jgi:hypothetical protein